MTKRPVFAASKSRAIFGIVLNYTESDDRKQFRMFDIPTGDLKIIKKDDIRVLSEIRGYEHAEEYELTNLVLNVRRNLAYGTESLVLIRNLEDQSRRLSNTVGQEHEYLSPAWHKAVNSQRALGVYISILKLAYFDQAHTYKTTPYTDGQILNMFYVPCSDVKKIRYPRALSDVLLPNRWVETTHVKYLRNLLKVGAVVPISEDRFEDLHDYISNKFASIEEVYTFEVVSGEELIDSYVSDDAPRSCMKTVYLSNGGDSSYLDLYRNNPDKVQLVRILQHGVYFGRALLWTSDQGTKILDRVYPSDGGIHTSLIRRWAERLGYAYKVRDTYTDEQLSDNKEYTITLDAKGLVGMPYLDTFKFANDWMYRKDKILISNKRHVNRPIQLTSAYGYFYQPNYRYEPDRDGNFRSYTELRNPAEMEKNPFYKEINEGKSN